MRATIVTYLIPGLLLTGCSTNFHSMPRSEATVGKPSQVHEDLVSLPEPNEPIVVSVYRFRDQTGQYKYSETGTNWSTAVTQGATSMLIKALDDSGWFTPVEREGLSNLLNERKIIASTRENYTAEDGSRLPSLPPLLYAGILLEGGIISYETNTFAGGYGVRYFGFGGSQQVRKDEVTVYLRAVSTQTGRILKTVYTTKSILSEQVDVGLYRYVKVKRLLELETGYSTNEPPNMCVLEAIEKAVQSLVIEGVLDGMWSLADNADMESPAIKDYLEERDREYRGIELLAREPGGLSTASVVSPSVGLGIQAALQQYAGDYPDPDIDPSVDVSLRWGMTDRFSLSFTGGHGEIGDSENFSATVSSLELRGLVHLLPYNRFNIFLTGGGGFMKYDAEDISGNEFARREDYAGWEPLLSAGVGCEYFLHPRFGITFTVDNRFPLTDELDGIDHGGMDDNYWNAKAGFTVYLPK